MYIVLKEMKNLTNTNKFFKIFLIIIFLIYFTSANFVLFSNNLFKMNNMELLKMITYHFVTGILFSIIFNKINILKNYIWALFLVFLSLSFKYIIEFGEISNEINFTKQNLFLFLLIVPLYITICNYISYIIIFKEQKK